MAKKITIQHLYNTGKTLPDVSKLEFGEIAICANAGNERIYTKNSNGGLAAFPTLEQVESLIDEATNGVITDANFGELQSQVNTHINNTFASDATATNRSYGHVILVNADLNGGENTNGAAAGLGHTHSQYQPVGNYLTGVTAGSGLAIVGVIANGDVELQLDGDTNNRLNSGVTAYNWGNHADAGYAKNDDLTSHTGNNDIHVTAQDKTNWNETRERLNLFLDESGTTESTLDSIIEFQKWFETHGTSASNMQTAITKNTTDISAISGVVKNNTTAITNNANNISLLSTSLNNISGSISTISQTVSNNETTINNIKLNYVDNIVSGANINVTSASSGANKGKTFTISHITPIDDSEATNIDFTNKNSGTTLTWGGKFTTLSSLKYDKNGHIINTGASTFILPTLNTGNTTTFGVVKLYEGELTLEDALVGTGESGIAVGKGHSHNQYATTDSVNTTLNEYIKFSDLSANTGDVIVISCGTY